MSTRRGGGRPFLAPALSVALALASSGVRAQEAEPASHQGGDVSIGGRIVVPEGEVRHGEVTSIGGTAVIDGTVDGDVTVIAGHLEVRGTILGDVNAIASRSTLHDGARVDGDFHNIAGTLHRGRVEVQGDLVNVGMGVPMPGLGWLGAIGSVLVYFAVLELLLIFLTLLVVCALVPERVRLVSEETPVRWPGALLAGIAGYAALPILMSLLLFSVLGIPLIPLVWCVFFVFKTLALAGIFHLVGSRLGRSMGREMSVLGAVLLGFAPFALVRLVFSAIGFPLSFLGWLFIWMPLQVVAVGLMILTRGGGRRPAVPSPVPEYAPAPAIPPAPAPEP
ncbi:MAG TPA: polymer-forming cytoskeletal protein [Candidatus Polarisedimenticolaceae bacterium]|nr:polymer-forming cytoskeletal protein [Candidatus Polarisedimenticolaceae bacterium]